MVFFDQKNQNAPMRRRCGAGSPAPIRPSLTWVCSPDKKGFLLHSLIVLPILASATPVTVVPLLPGPASIGLTIYAMGLFPLPAQFGRFTGTLTVDQADPSHCIVALRIETASLQMADASRLQLALGPRLLDAAHYPLLIYQGSCAGGQAAGALTLHGVTRPLTLSASRDGDRVEAAGTLIRQDYGVDGWPGLIGRTIRIRFSVKLPPGLAARLDP
jgi:polyisoprenoid-binding protein YceI